MKLRHAFLALVAGTVLAAGPAWAVDLTIVSGDTGNGLKVLRDILDRYEKNTGNKVTIVPMPSSTTDMTSSLPPIAPEAVEALMAYDWGRNNIRELRNVIERMIIASDGDELTRAAVPAEILRTPHAASRTSADAPRTFEEQKQEAERQIIIQALERNEWHVTKTAKELGLSDHASLLKIMRRLGVQRDTKGADS